MLRAIPFLVLVTAALASDTLDALVDTASTFSAAMGAGLEGGGRTW